MEAFKKYLPWIIGAVVLLFVLSRLRGGSTEFLPQTEIVQTPQSDPFAALRGEAFNVLAQVGLAQVEAESRYQQGLIERATGLDALRFENEARTRALEFEREIRSKALDVDLEKSRLSTGIAERISNLNFLQREQDRQVQQGAIDRFYSSRNTGNILSSVNTALQSIFSGRRRGGGIFGTPPIFPGGF